MAGFEIKKATRKQARARIALCGPSGSGKTMSALKLAAGLAAELPDDASTHGTTIGVIDTERRSASLYADVVPFVTIELEPPYSPERYRQAIEALEKHGCQVIIIDQISHEWSGHGGVLEMVDSLQATGKNKMQAWAKYTPEHQRFVDRVLQSSAHIIATMRSKTDWHIDESTRKPTKVGLAPVQRDGIEYEFTAVLDLDIGHGAVASKDRTRVFGDTRITLDESWGRKLALWLNQGEEYTPEKPAVPPGTYVKPADYVEPPDPPRKDAKQPDAADGFGPTPSDDPGPLIPAKHFWAAIDKKAKAMGWDRAEKERIARLILGLFNLESSAMVPETLWPEMHDAIKVYGVEK